MKTIAQIGRATLSYIFFNRFKNSKISFRRNPINLHQTVKEFFESMEKYKSQVGKDEHHNFYLWGIEFSLHNFREIDETKTLFELINFEYRCVRVFDKSEYFIYTYHRVDSDEGLKVFVYHLNEEQQREVRD